MPSPIIGAPSLTSGQAIPETTVNEIVAWLEAGARVYVVYETLTAPPGSPVDGSRYLVASAGATGAFAGHENEIALRVAGQWEFPLLAEGVLCLERDNDELLIRSIAGTWSKLSGSFLAVAAAHLTDVDLTGLADGDMLVYDTGSSKFIPAPVPGGGMGGTVPDGGTDGQVLTKQSAADQDVDWEDIPSQGWEVISTQTPTGVSLVDFPNLGDYSELLLYARGITNGTNTFQAARVSVDNGSTFFATSGHYVQNTTAGVESNQTQFTMTDAAATAARSCFIHIFNSNVNGPPKRAVTTAGVERWFVASGSPIDALRFFQTAGTNITGGTVTLLGKR